MSVDAEIDARPTCETGLSQVPLIDLSQPGADQVNAIASACREWGLFLVIGHGIDTALTESCLAQMRRFCAKPLALVDSGPPQFRPIPWAEFRRRRAEGDYGNYGTEVQISDWAI